MNRSSYSCQILMKFEFSRQILEKSLNVPLVGNELFHANGRTDMTKLTVAFHNFVNALKK